MLSELQQVAQRLHRRGLTVIADEMNRLSMELSGDPVEDVLAAYRRMHDLSQFRRFAEERMECAYWQGDNEEWCDRFAPYTYDGKPTCYKHYRYLARKEPTHDNLIATIVHTATVRKNNLSREQRCPFGLSVPVACLNVGAIITLMEPDRGSFKINKHLYNEQCQKERCPFATKILKKQRAVDCNYGTTTEGL